MGFVSIVWGFGLTMEEALLPSNWLCILSLRVFRLSGDLESRPRLRGRDLQPAVPFARLYARTVPGAGCPSEAPFLGCMPLWARRGQGIQLWPHSLTIFVLDCRSDTEQILRAPPRRSAANSCNAVRTSRRFSMGVLRSASTSPVTLVVISLRTPPLDSGLEAGMTGGWWGRGGSRKPGLLPSPGSQGSGTGPDGMRRWRSSLGGRSAFACAAGLREGRGMGLGVESSGGSGGLP